MELNSFTFVHIVMDSPDGITSRVELFPEFSAGLFLAWGVDDQSFEIEKVESRWREVIQCVFGFLFRSIFIIIVLFWFSLCFLWGFLFLWGFFHYGLDCGDSGGEGWELSLAQDYSSENSLELAEVGHVGEPFGQVWKAFSQFFVDVKSEG